MRGRDRQQHDSRGDGDERLEGQYEKDAWPPDSRPGSPRGRQAFPGGKAASAGDERRPGDEEPYEPYQRSDERLCGDISERLRVALDIDSSDVTVGVTSAKVVLDGTVPERHMKHAIENLVDACPGVQDIENKIRVKR